MMKRMCAVCCKVATADKFGDGIHCPKTTCLTCKGRARFVEAKVIMMIKRTVREVRE